MKTQQSENSNKFFFISGYYCQKKKKKGKEKQKKIEALFPQMMPLHRLIVNCPDVLEKIVEWFFPRSYDNSLKTNCGKQWSPVSGD